MLWIELTRDDGVKMHVNPAAITYMYRSGIATFIRCISPEGNVNVKEQPVEIRRLIAEAKRLTP